MMNPGHAATGWCAGISLVAVVNTLGWITSVLPERYHRAFEQTALEFTSSETAAGFAGAVSIAVPLFALYLLYGTAGAGWALVADIDHDGSLIYTSGGFVVEILGEGLQWLSRRVYAWTARDHDPPATGKRGEHRGFIHSPQFAVLVGLLVGLGVWATRWVGPVILWAVVTLGLLSLSRWLNRLTRISWIVRDELGAALISASIVGLYTLAFGVELYNPVLFGFSSTLGMLTHDFGDGCTQYGVPWKSWYPHWCKKCRKQVDRSRCDAWDRRAPWHYRTCRQCERARAKPKCRMWDRSNNLPAWLVWTTGKSTREHVVTWAAFLGGLGIIAYSLHSLFP